jgi:ribonuclease VapC
MCGPNLWSELDHAGVNPAALNLGDCFSHEVAKQHSCPLLFIGADFSKADLESVL